LPEQPFPGAAVDPEGGWQCGAAHYDLGERVGKGAFAEVFAAQCRTGPRAGTRVAVKVGHASRHARARFLPLAPAV
jgi:hypothetical protein